MAAPERQDYIPMLRGPFGSFFDIDRFKGKNLLLIPGGLGLAPMRSLVQYVIDTRDLYRDVTIAYGTKCPEEILFPEEIESWKQMAGLTVRQAVDVCSLSWTGPVGLITTLIHACLLGGYTREASGHNPRNEAERSRRRISHKLEADMLRFGELGCVDCGRCDMFCPTGIGIRAVAKRIVDRFS